MEAGKSHKRMKVYEKSSKAIEVDDGGHEMGDSREEGKDQAKAPTSSRFNLKDVELPANRGCEICKIASLPFRSKHCKDCNKCVRKYDHHCFWIGGCVGELNHRLFYAFVVL